MSQTTVRGRLCALLNEPNAVSVPLFALLGVAGLALLATDVAAGEPLTDQAWFVAFVAGYAVGARELFGD